MDLEERHEIEQVDLILTVIQANRLQQLVDTLAELNLLLEELDVVLLFGILTRFEL